MYSCLIKFLGKFGLFNIHFCQNGYYKIFVRLVELSTEMKPVVKFCSSINLV